MKQEDQNSAERTEPPVCLSIAGLDPSGGAGVLADVRAFAAFGCFPSAAVTSITFQNTTGVFGAEAVSRGSVAAQIEPVFDDYRVSAVKTGMLPNRDVIEAVSGILEERPVPHLVVDPVVRSTSGFDLIDGPALEALIERLFGLAEVITPNIAEAERISGIEIGSGEAVRKAAEIILSMGARAVLIKGGHLRSEDGSTSPKRVARDFLFFEGRESVFEAPFIDTTATHGTGCVLSASIAACLARGLGLEDSVKAAKKFVNRAINSAPMVGKGHSPIDIDPTFASLDG